MLKKLNLQMLLGSVLVMVISILIGSVLIGGVVGIIFAIISEIVAGMYRGCSKKPSVFVNVTVGAILGGGVVLIGFRLLEVYQFYYY